MIDTPMIKKDNVFSINDALQFLESYIRYRLLITFRDENLEPPVYTPLEKTSYINKFIALNILSDIEIMMVLLALVPHISSAFLKSVLLEFLTPGGEFSDFGGTSGKNHRGIIPTGETALFIAAGNSIEDRIQLIDFLETESVLFKKNILYLEAVPFGEPKMSGRLVLDEEYVALLTTGKVLKPTLSQNFPASRIDTELEWGDLVLQEKTLEQIQEIEVWLKHNETLLQQWDMRSKIKPGYRVMLFGPPGTGKTLTASLLGKYTNRDVYRVDLSMVVSKYIGETEKNLSGLFDKAANKDWILFFDEADAVFGKRTNVRDAHDKYANQEVSYLLQRIEAHPGLVILASNFKNNIDVAFTRRFQSIIEFQLPGTAERFQLWKNNLPKNISLEDLVCLDELSRKYAITGANIINVIQYACLKTIAAGNESIQQTYLLEGLKKEYLKEGKTINILN